PLVASWASTVRTVGVAEGSSPRQQAEAAPACRAGALPCPPRPSLPGRDLPWRAETFPGGGEGLAVAEIAGIFEDAADDGAGAVKNPAEKWLPAAGEAGDTAGKAFASRGSLCADAGPSHRDARARVDRCALGSASRTSARHPALSATPRITMLKRLDVDNYRTLVDFSLEPPATSVLVGENGTGKTAIWEVLAALQDILVHGAAVEDTFKPTTVTRWGSSNDQTIRIELERPDGDPFRYELVVRHDREKQRVAIAKESLHVGAQLLFDSGPQGVHLYGDKPTKGNAAARAKIPFRRSRSFISELEPRADNKLTVAFRELVASIWLLKLDPPRMASVSKAEETWLERDGTNFAGWYRDFAQREEDKTTALRDELGAVLHGFVRFKNELAGGTARELRVICRTPEGEDYPVTFEELSDGQRSLVVLYALLHAVLPGPALLVLDEPENFVALAEIEPWLVAFNSAAEGRSWQRIVISHNPALIDFMAADMALEATRERGGPTRVAPLEIDLSEGLRASEILALGRDDAEGAAE
ncbi:MAG TPA: AAA family ATPase, partial [Byssovorax sp.]